MSLIYFVKLGETLPGEKGRLGRVTKFAEHLASRGHDVLWITSNFNHQLKIQRNASLEKEAMPFGFRVKLIDAPEYSRNVSVTRLWHHILFSLKLKAFLSRSEKPDLIWCCFPTVPVTVNVSKWSKRHNVKLIIDVRDIVPDVFLGLVPNSLKMLANFTLAPVRRAISRAFVKADGIVAVSKGYLRWSLDFLPTRSNPEAAVLPLGYDKVQVNIQNLSDDVKSKLALLERSTSTKIVYVGSLGSSYDIPTVIETAKRFSAEGANVEFIVAGTGQQSHLLIEASRKLKNFHYLGWLNQDELASVLAQSNIGLMPYKKSAQQGLPNKIYEYMAFSLPIVNSLPGETEQFISEHRIGLNYQTESATSLKLALNSLMKSADEAIIFGQNSGKLFGNYYECGILVEQMSDFVDTALGNSRAARRASEAVGNDSPIDIATLRLPH